MIYTILLPSTRDWKFLPDADKADSVLMATTGMVTTQKIRKPGIYENRFGLPCL